MYSYCAQDIEVERQIYKRTLPLSTDEQEMWEIDHTINQRGIRVDLSAASEAINIVAFEAKRLNEEIREVTKNAVATTSSHAQLTQWLLSRGVANVNGVAKSDVADLLSIKPDQKYTVGPENRVYYGHELLPIDCRQALEIRRDASKSSTAKFQSLLQRSNSDKRMRSTLQYHGAGTGRWAGRGFQLHNLPRPKLKQSDLAGLFGVLSGDEGTII